MRNLRKVGVGGGAALLAAALVLPASGALANQTVQKQEFGAASSAEILDIHLLGRHIAVGQASVSSTLDAVNKNIQAEAKGIATMLVPAASVVARFNDAAAPGGKACVAGLDQVTNLLGSATNGAGLPLLGGLLPKLDLNLGCGTATMGGDITTDFFADATGGLVSIKLAMPEVVKGLAGTVRNLVGGLGTGNVGLGTLTSVLNGVPVAGDVVNQLGTLGLVDGLLGNLLGGAGAASLTDGLPIVSDLAALDQVTGLLNLDMLSGVMNPTTTVDNLLAGLEKGDLLKINLGVASARNAGSVNEFLSTAIAEGGSIEILPGFGGILGSADKANDALLKIEIAKSTASVQMIAGAEPTAHADSTIVRVSSPILPDLSMVTNLLSGVPVVNGLIGSTGLLAADNSLVGTVNGLVGGVPVVGNLLGFDATVKALGLNAGPGYIEVAPGMSVSILCDGLVAPLCSEISVGAVKPAEKLANGRTRIESSVATIHLLKGLDTLGAGLPVVGDLLGGVGLGSILGSDLVGGLLQPVLGTAGLSLGEKSDVAGIKLSLGHAMAEAGGVRVMGSTEEQAREAAPGASAPVDIPALPRTGGLPLAAAVPMLLGASAGLRILIGRRR